MARRIKDRNLESRDARKKLEARGKPYWRAIERGTHLGFRRRAKGAGTWVVRRYIGDDIYRTERLATADDLSDADGVLILDYWQAVDALRDTSKKRAQKSAAPITVRKAMEDYLEYLEARGKPNADSKYRSDAYIIPALGHKLVAKLTRKDIRTWHSDMVKMPARKRSKKGERPQFRDAPLSDPEVTRKRQASANRLLTILKASLNHAYDEGKVDSNDAWGRRSKPFEDVDSARQRYLSIGEARRLINATPPSFRRMVQAALQTGARYGELCKLTVMDFNPDSGTVTFRKTKGKKTRHVTLTEEGIRFFRQVCLGQKGNDPMFRHPNGRAWHTSEQLRFMAEASQNARLDPPITFHGLRHTWASQAVMNGVPLIVVAKNLGHSDTRMVEKHYGHLTDSYVSQAIRAGAPRYGRVKSGNVVSLAERRQ